MSEKRNTLNRIYEPLILRLQELMAGLRLCGEFKIASGFSIIIPTKMKRENMLRIASQFRLFRWKGCAILKLI